MAFAFDYRALARSRPRNKRVGLRVMYRYIRPRRFALLIGSVLSLATGVTGLLLPLVVRALITSLSGHYGLSRLVVLLCLLMVADAVLGAVGGYLLLRIADSVLFETRKLLVRQLLRITVGALDDSEPGDLMARVSVDTTLLHGVVSNAVVPAVTATLTGLGAIVLMGIVDVEMLGVTLAVVALIAVAESLVVPKIGRAATERQRAVGQMTAALERMFGAFRTMKACGAEAREGAHIEEAAEHAWRASVRADLWSAVAGNSAELAAQFAFLAVFAVGGSQVASGAISVGTLVAFLMYLVYLLGPIGQLANAARMYQSGAAAVTRIEEARELPVEPAESSGPSSYVANGDGPAGVEFADVRFRYGADYPEAHHGISFVIPPRGVTAFVGPSGSGKTTVFSLIERFYEPDSGRICIDGTDTRDWQLAPLRAAIGYVEQDAPVLSGTLRENLMFGAPGAPARDLDAVLCTTRLDRLVERLPDGLDTFVGHRGMRLSGGERQRVAIARALLRRPRLLLLDEATSQLDAINEAALRETIAEVAQTITVIVVAHRLSTVTMADQIIVMDNGCIKATGTHADLVTTNALYAELASTQFLAADA